MNPVARALWFIETHFAAELTLDDVAGAASVSRYHLTRGFGYATGRSVMRYVRARRLTEAARALATGAPDILALALQAGYGSHEAFTRAFNEQFGVSPESVRSRGDTFDLQLVEPVKMNENQFASIAAPRFENPGTIRVAGISQRYNDQTSAGIPAQWQRFGPQIARIPALPGGAACGVLCNGDADGNIDYLCGVEVADFAAVPTEFARLTITPQRYAVFSHGGHVAEIRRVWHTIWNRWLPDSGTKVVEAPSFERYGASFNPVTGQGGFEIWIPLAS
jgi:AraC family transcriptional regulator